jgi:hypothetical protein
MGPNFPHQKPSNLRIGGLLFGPDNLVDADHLKKHWVHSFRPKRPPHLRRGIRLLQTGCEKNAHSVYGPRMAPGEEKGAR